MPEDDSVVAQRPLPAQTRSPLGTLGFVLCCLAVPQTLQAAQDLGEDPQRWSKPYVYVCLAATIYASVWLVSWLAVQLASRGWGSMRRWLPNPLVLLLACFIWARFHDEIDPFLAFAAQTTSAFVAQIVASLEPEPRHGYARTFEQRRRSAH